MLQQVTIAFLFNQLEVLFVFSRGRYSEWFGQSSLKWLPLLLLQLLLMNAEAAGASVGGTPDEVKKIVAEISDAEQILEGHKSTLQQEILLARESKATNIQYLLQLQRLSNEFIFDKVEIKGLQKKSIEGRRYVQQGLDQEALNALEPVSVSYHELILLLDVIKKTVEAEKQADATIADSKMYFKMRKRQSQLPPKTLKAYGVMGIAKANRDKGLFNLSLQQWAQAEKMVKDSVNELIAEQAKWLEEAKQSGKLEREEIRVKVESLLADYFVGIPAGKFVMGSENTDDEAPQHNVSLSAFKMGKTEVTFELWDLCVEGTSCFVVPKDYGWGRGDKPVINVSYKDITHRFIPWLSKMTGKKFRLPSESEWEYAARAGSKTEFSWGDSALCDKARYDGGAASICNARDKQNKGPLPVKSFQANAFGLYDMHGNVWEWVEDCWNPSYEGAPVDGVAWLSGNCAKRVLRGGSWDYPKSELRSANRFSSSYTARRPGYGFRLVLEE